MLWYEHKKKQLDLCKRIGFTPLGDVEKGHFIYMVECDVCRRRFHWNSHTWQIKHLKAHHPLEYLKLIKSYIEEIHR